MLAGLVPVLAIDGVCYYVSMHRFNASFDHPTAGFLIANLLYSAVSRTLSGFVAGDIVHRRTLLPGVALAALLLLFGFFNLEKGFGVLSRGTVYVVVLNVVGPLFAILGADLWMRVGGRARRP